MPAKWTAMHQSAASLYTTHRHPNTCKYTQLPQLQRLLIPTADPETLKSTYNRLKPARANGFRTWRRFWSRGQAGGDCVTACGVRVALMCLIHFDVHARAFARNSAKRNPVREYRYFSYRKPPQSSTSWTPQSKKNNYLLNLKSPSPFTTKILKATRNVENGVVWSS